MEGTDETCRIALRERLVKLSRRHGYGSRPSRKSQLRELRAGAVKVRSAAARGVGAQRRGLDAGEHRATLHGHAGPAFNSYTLCGCPADAGS